MTPQSALVAELGRRETARDRVLRALLAAGSAGVLNTTLNDICFRYGGRIHELRNDGYRVDKVHVAEGLWRYVLAPKDRLF